MSPDWSDQEVDFIIDDYFAMLRSELEGRSFSKTAHRAQLLPRLNNRSEGSVEFKHQNISAVLDDLDHYYIRGYKPRYNYQQLLEDQVIKALERYERQLEPLEVKFAEDSVPVTPVNPQDFGACLEERPAKSKPKVREPSFRATKVNRQEKEQRNTSLGIAGEQFVIEYEKWRLAKAGRNDLAASVDWTSNEKGDGTGYDILSKNGDGRDRYIEVKTTKFSKGAPIYFTYNELMFSHKHASQFYLYRVFNFGPNPKLFILQGCYSDYCELMPMAYMGIF